MILNRYFVSSKHRLQIVYLLSGFLLRKVDHCIIYRFYLPSTSISCLLISSLFSVHTCMKS